MEVTFVEYIFNYKSEKEGKIHTLKLSEDGQGLSQANQVTWLS